MKALKIRTILGSIAAASTRFAARFVSVLVVAFFVCAHAYAQEARSLRVYYPFDNAVVSESYLDNHPTLIKVDSLAAAAIGVEDYTLTIISYSSPEGNNEYNKALSTRRAAALRNFIIKKHPELKGRINIEGKGESWDDLRKAVESDSRLGANTRSSMLRIIDSKVSPDSKEEQLKQFESYRRLYSTYFRRFRYAEIQFDGIGFDANGNVVIPGKTAGEGAGAGVVAGSTDKTAGEGAGQGAGEGTGAGVVTGSTDKTAGEGAGAGVVAGSTDKTAGEGAGQGAGEGAGAGVVAGSTDKTASEGAGQTTGEGAAVAAGAATATTQKDSSDIASSRTGAGAPNIIAGEPERTGADASSSKFRNSSNRGNILFETQKTDINPDYEGNDDLFAEIAKFLESHTPEEFDSLVVVSGCSIDGPTSTNERVSRERGQALYNWINKNYPQYKDKLHMDSRGEDWDKFRESVVLDKDLDDDAKSRILTIIDSDDTPSRKEERLRELPEWDRHIKDNVLPQDRYASLRSVYTKKEEPKQEPVAPEAPELEDVEIAEDTLAVSDTTMVVPTDSLVVDKLTTPEKKYPLFAAGSNLLYDLAITPNIHAEVPIGKKWSVYADYTFPWWLARDNSRAYQMLKWDLGARRYLNRMDENDPMDILRGHFLGLDLSAGYYDFEPHHKGVQGEFQLAGLEYGYTWKMGDNWRLEAVIGAGFMGTHYRSYKADATDRHLIYQKSEKLYWLGPTKAGISVKYIFDHYKKDKQGR